MEEQKSDKNMYYFNSNAKKVFTEDRTEIINFLKKDEIGVEI